MNERRTYSTAAAFRAALEGRLKKSALDQGIDYQRLRRQIASDRLLCRLFALPDPPWVLKDGYAMELRLNAARATRDIDVGIRSLPTDAQGWDANASAVLESLRELVRTNLEDYFDFLIGEPTEDLDAAPYGGARYPVEARMGGRTFVKFHVDVSAGDVMREPYELLHGRDWLGFAGVPGGTFLAISAEEQFAEKLHAYTLPRKGRENTRVKDLIDLVLLVTKCHLDTARVCHSIRETFQRRKTHDTPTVLVRPPDAWSGPFGELAAECGIDRSLEEQFTIVAEFYSKLGL